MVPAAKMMDFKKKDFVLVEDMIPDAGLRGSRAALAEGSVASAVFLDFCTVPDLLALRRSSKSLKWLVKKARLQVQVRPDTWSKVKDPQQVTSVVSAFPDLRVPVTITLDSLLWSLAHVREAGALANLNLKYTPQCKLDIADVLERTRPKDVSVGGAVLPSLVAPYLAHCTTLVLHEGSGVQAGFPWAMLTSLRSLHLIGTVGVTHVDLLPLAGQLQGLEVVHVPGVCDVSAFTGLSSLSAVIQHELRGVQALAEGLQQLTILGGSLSVPLQLSSFRQLRSVVLRGCRGTNAGTFHTPPSSLTRLEVVHCRDWADRSTDIAPEELYHLRHVQQLHLEGCVTGLVTRHALSPLAGACSHLTLLGPRLAEDALMALPKLRTLRIDGRMISYEHLVSSMPSSLRALAIQSGRLLGLPTGGPGPGGAHGGHARTLPGGDGPEEEQEEPWTVQQVAALAQCKPQLRTITTPLTLQAASRLYFLLLSRLPNPDAFMLRDMSVTGGQPLPLLPCTAGQGWESRIAEVQVTLMGRKRRA